MVVVVVVLLVLLLVVVVLLLVLLLVVVAQEDTLRLRQMALANQVHELTAQLARSRVDTSELHATADEVRGVL